MSYSKKPMNKTDRETVIVAMVKEACAAGAKKLHERYRKQHNTMETILVDLFRHKYPGVDPSQYAQLLQDRIVDSANFSTHYVTAVVPKANGEGTDLEKRTPCYTNFSLSQRPGLSFEDVTFMLRQVLQNGDVRNMISINFGFDYARNGSVSMKNSFPAVPESKATLFMLDYEEKRELPSELNHRFIYCHKQVLKLNNETLDLVKQAYDLYEEIHAGIAAIRTPHALAELMPIAVKHFPDHWINEPKKELADPAYLNELTAKLKAGLPV